MGQELDSIRVYSKDRNVWVGMKTKDANTTEEKMKLFNFADQNGDGEISKKELDRYNGPLLVENFPEKTARIIGNVAGLPMSGLILADNEVDYYPGLEIEHVDKAGRVVFNKIDLDHNNVLSSDEMKKATEAKQRIDETREKLNNIQFTRKNLAYFGVIGIAGSAGLIALGCSPIGWGIAAVASLALMIANRHVAKNKAQKVLNEVQDVHHPYTKQAMEELKHIV